MKEEIKELDMNKYLVLKWDDIQEIPLEVKEKLAFVEGYINTYRHRKGKKDNKYLVLNLEDEINTWELLADIELIMPLTKDKNHGVKVKDIAVALVNAVLRAKGD